MKRLRELLIGLQDSIRGIEHMTSKMPNSRQLYCFMMPEETEFLFKYIHSKAYLVFAPRSNSAKPRTQPIYDNIGQFFYCPNELVGYIYMYRISNNVYVLDQTTSPVIEVDCSVLYKDKLTRGRIYFRSGYVGKERMVIYPESLYEAFNDIVRYLRKEFLTKERKYGAYLSKAALEFITKGGLLDQF